jgi:hypothetical protein
MQPVLIDVTLAGTRPLLYCFANEAETEALVRGEVGPALWLPPTLSGNNDTRTDEEQQRVNTLRAKVIAKANKTGGQILPDKRVDRDPILQEIASKRLSLDARGRVIIPQRVIFSCLRDAGCDVALPKRQISYSFTGDTILPSLMRFLNPHYVLEQCGWSADYRFIRSKEDRNKRLIADYRVVVHPRFEVWSIRLQVIMTPHSGFTLDHAKRLFTIAGEQKGLGAMRGPRKERISFGAFRIDKWDAAEYDGHTPVDRPTFAQVARQICPP